MDLALNNLQKLICHKTQQTKPNKIASPVKFTLILFKFAKQSYTSVQKRDFYVLTQPLHDEKDATQYQIELVFTHLLHFFFNT